MASPRLLQISLHHGQSESNEVSKPEREGRKKVFCFCFTFKNKYICIYTHIYIYSLPVLWYANNYYFFSVKCLKVKIELYPRPPPLFFSLC